MRNFYRDGNGNAVSDLVINGTKVGLLIAKNTMTSIGDGSESIRENDSRVTAKVSLYVLNEDGTVGDKYPEKVLAVNGLASEIGSTDIAGEEMREWFVSKLVDTETVEVEE